jgi:hypothetical protein
MMQKKQNIVINAPKAPPKVDELTEVPEQKQQFSDAQKASLRNAGVDDTTIGYIENSIYMFWPIIYIFFIFLENYFPQLKGKRLSLTTITTLVCTLLVKIYSKIESGKSFTDLIFDLVKKFIPDSVWQRIALGAFGAAGLFYLARTNSAAVLEWFSSMVAYLKGTTFTYEHWKQTGDDLFKIVECTGQDSDFAIPANIVSSKDPPKSETDVPVPVDATATVTDDVPVATEPVVTKPVATEPDTTTTPVTVTITAPVPAPAPVPAATLDAVPAPAVVISDLTKEEEEKLEEDDKLLKAVKKEKKAEPKQETEAKAEADEKEKIKPEEIKTKNFDKILENAKKEEAANKKNYLEKALKEEESENKKQFTEFKNKLKLQSLKNAAEESSRQENEAKIATKAAKKKAEADAKKKPLKDFKSSKIITAAKKTELKEFSKLNPKNLKLSDKAKKKLKDFLDKGTPEQKLIYFKRLNEWSSSENDISRLVDISQGKVFDSLESTDLLDYFKSTNIENWEKTQLDENIKPEKVAETSKNLSNELNNLNNEAKEDFLTNLNNAESTKLKDPFEYLNNLIIKNKDNKEKLINENYIPPENKIQIRPKIIEKLKDFLDTGTPEQKLNYFKRLDEWSSSENDLSRLVDISRGTPSIQDYLRTTNIENWEKTQLDENIEPEKIAETSNEIKNMLNSLSEKKKNEFKKLLNENTDKTPKEYLKSLIDEDQLKNNNFNDLKENNFLPKNWVYNESLLNKLNDLKTENEKKIYLQFYNDFKESPESLKNLADIAKKDYWKSYNNNNNNIDISEILKIDEISPEIKNSINNKIAYNGYKTSKYLPETWDYSESLLNKLNELDTSEKKEIYLNFLKEDNTWNKSPETISRLVDISSNNVWKKWELTDIYDQYHYGSIEKKTSPETVAKEIVNEATTTTTNQNNFRIINERLKILQKSNENNKNNENVKNRAETNIETLEIQLKIFKVIEQIQQPTQIGQSETIINLQKSENKLGQPELPQKSETEISPQKSFNNKPNIFTISDDIDNYNENNNNAIIPENKNNYQQILKNQIDLLTKTVNELNNAKQTGNETIIEELNEKLKKENKKAEEEIDSFFSLFNNFFDYLASFFTFENLQDFGSHVATRTTNLATETATKLALNYIQNSITGFNIPITTSAIVTAAATTAFNTALNYLFSDKPLEYNVDWPLSTALHNAPAHTAATTVATAIVEKLVENTIDAVAPEGSSEAIKAVEQKASTVFLGTRSHSGNQANAPLRIGGRYKSDTQELIPQDLNPIRLALEALLCFMIWFGSKKCDSIKGFLITVMVAILLLFALMAITMGIVTGRNCGVGGKDLLQRIVYYAFVSIGYYFTDLFSGGAGDIFAKFATKTATFGALYFLFESVTAVSEKKKPLKEEAKKLLENLKKDKK